MPSCGYDSVPSDITAFLANQTLKALPNAHQLEMGLSMTAHKVRGGISGGTLATVMSVLEDVPKDKAKASAKSYSTSPGNTCLEIFMAMKFDVWFVSGRPPWTAHQTHL